MLVYASGSSEMMNKIQLENTEILIQVYKMSDTVFSVFKLHLCRKFLDELYWQDEYTPSATLHILSCPIMHCFSSDCQTVQGFQWSLIYSLCTQTTVQVSNAGSFTKIDGESKKICSRVFFFGVAP